MARLAGKVAIITGGAAGIGRESALLFAREGSRVAIADLDAVGGAATVANIEAAGGEAIFLPTDVSRGSDVIRLVAGTEERFGKVDILFNNAGIFPAADASVLDTPEDVWDVVMAVNLKGVFLGCQHGIPALLRAGGGSIINTASFVALVGAATSQIAYTASKGGVLSMTREIAVEFARQGIRANAICPGPVDTELLRAILSVPEERERRMVHVPLGRPANGSEIAQAALFLASDESSYVTGSTFTVDGGITSAYVTPR